MKNENIKKINTLGKVCRILLIIARVVFIIGFVGCIVGAIAFLAIPKNDVITADGTLTAQVRVDTSRIPSIFSDDLLDLRENNVDFDAFGTGAKWIVERNVTDNEVIYDIDGALDIDNSNSIILGAVGSFSVGAVMCALMLIIVIFAGKLAKALEVCNSPFEANVLKAMKQFAFSLIPIGVIQTLWNSSIGLTTIFVIIAIIIFSFIFSYGAELQKESDETL